MRNKYSLLIFLSIMLSASILSAQNRKLNPGSQIGTSELFDFHSHFWFNLHHFAQQEALLNTVADSSIIDNSKWALMKDSELKAFKNLIHYYKKELVDKDLRTSDYMLAFKEWVIQQEDQLKEIPDSFLVHTNMLNAAKPVYDSHFWKDHQKAIDAVLKNNLPLILQTEKAVADELAELTKSYWQEEKIRVDICFYAKSSEFNLRNRPYNPLNPVHIMMNACPGADEPRGNWLELLYHEASHNLIGSRTGFVAGTILDVARQLDQKPPRSLWHAYLFYFSGVVTQKALVENGNSDYKLYMIRNKVFSRYFPYLDKHLSEYIHGNSSLHDATRKIVTELNRNQNK